ncbi:MAG: hypothetical protein R3200_08715 [Xanthomonadales bacterium]|nr:hypothetical protein [Xanthomonadales bacterium]
MAGYSGTPLAKKLGIKVGSRVALLGAPDQFEATLAPLPKGVYLLRRARSRVDVIVAFVRTPGELENRLARGQALLEADGGLWMAWPKNHRA